MALEIERKFLVRNDEWRTLGSPVVFRQGFLNTEPERTVRVRIAGERAFLTVKGITKGTTRLEYEYPIPVEDAAHMLEHLCERPLIEKTRTVIEYCGHRWEVDAFEGENAGLVVAEIELTSSDEAFEKPAWIGKEVTDDPRYYNSMLSRSPYSTWPENAH
ncbi:MAG: CYTH domain-containing protein [Duodenibacillus sp.]